MDGQHHLQHVELARILYNDEKKSKKNISISKGRCFQWYPQLSVVPAVFLLYLSISLSFFFIFTL